MRTNLTSELQLTDSLLTDQLTNRSRNRPLVVAKICSSKRLIKHFEGIAML